MNDAHKVAATRTKAASVSHDWMTPVSTENPCGHDIEYDPEFVVLAARVAARAEAQYGDFVGMPEPVNWSEIDRDCRRLMLRAKDLRLAVLFTRCRTQLAGAEGMAEGLELLAAWMNAFPDAIHPQLSVDEERDAALEIRMNALQALTETDGLMSDVREIVLPRTSAARLQVRDVERAFAQPRPADALAPESVVRQLDDLRAQQPQGLAGFARAQLALSSVKAWCREHQEAWQPDVTVLERLLGRIAGDTQAAAHAALTQPEEKDASMHAVVHTDRQDEAGVEAAPASNDSPAQSRTQPGPVSVPVHTEGLGRQGALERMREARAWFEQHEPSSPVAMLLRQAERMVGRRYAEVVGAIPPELLAQWDGEPV
ncbi:type VI secretion system protein TssA [Paraburkholderia adhaesiva]|uniref:type VI secretion system protein TssA n=1 Tax=Paraburkholderia adhaesiva TaxID=2883244 RepID=UPI001F1FAE4F|nr:type VI secretion system ImpA family N-terminal domain-containing protein [Paraburkholderia adhaesiva]